MKNSNSRTPASARRRLSAAFIGGVLIAVVSIVLGANKFAALAAWDTVILIYGSWVWLSVWSMNATNTKLHAVSENPGRALADVIMVSTSVASVFAVVILVMQASSSSGFTKAAEISLGLVSIILSWGIVHTTFMLRYARLYYGRPEGGVSFNENESPCYTDFAYLAFTLGMTFQVSDTDLMTKEIRATALRHALLSYFFGTVIIATTINTLASISS